MATTITQGKTFTDTGGRTGVAQFNPNTGAPLSAGQSVGVNPVSGASSNPISKGQTITDTQGRTGTAAFDQNTGAPLQDGQKVVTNSPQGVQNQGLGNIQSSSNPVNQNPVTSPSTAIVPQPITPNPNKYKDTHAALAGTAAPQDAGTARSLATAAMPTQPQDTTQVDTFLSADPMMTKIMSSITDLLNPTNQTTSLMEDYKSLYKDSGLDAINKELIDADTVINGTEADIRNEIQTAGGLGTDSQVQAMALARNKSLLKRYNQLVQMKTDATNQLNTMSQLNATDKQMAQTKVNSQISNMFQLANFRQQATKNVQEAFQNMVNKVGYAGAYAAYKQDPQQLGFIEQTMGLEKGGLAKLAAQPDYEMLTKKANYLKAIQPDTSIVDVGGHKLLVDKSGNVIKEITAPGTSSGTMQLAQSKSNIDTLNSITGGGFNSAVGPSSLARSSTGLWDSVKQFLGGAAAGGTIGAVAGAPFAGVGAIPGAVVGGIGGGLAAVVKGQYGNLTGETQNTIANIQQVANQLTLDKLSQAKANGATFGALSDSEHQLLSAAASKIGTWSIKDGTGNVIGYNTTEANMRKELDKINNFAKLDYVLKGGNAAEVGVQVMPDGTYWTNNSDGTVTKIN